MDEESSDVISPDGSLNVEFKVNEYKMSHWVYCPRITDVQSHEVLLDLWGDPAWDAAVSFEAGGEVILRLRRYPGYKPGFTVHIDPRLKTFFFEDQPERREVLSNFNRRLEARHKAQAG